MQIVGFLRLMVDKGASDLHLMAGSPPVIRVYGILITLDDWPVFTAADIQSFFAQITSDEQQHQFDQERELDFSYSVPGLSRFRVNVLQQRGTLSLAIRVVPQWLPSIDELEIPQICKELVLRDRGLILVTGAAGSGKSTTLAAMINYLNENSRRNIITIEDPIEFIFTNQKCLIRQRDLGDDTRSFASALSHSLRHDPDVIVIGEMRDLATISTAVRAAETGHLIIGTLHTNDAAQSIDRIIDVFPSAQQRQVRLQLSQVIVAVLSQRLLRRSPEGRIAAFEIMLGTPTIMKLIREEKLFEITAHMETCTREGMQTMDQALSALVRRGIVSYEEASAHSTSPEKVRNLVLQSESRVLSR